MEDSNRLYLQVRNNDKVPTDSEKRQKYENTR